MLKSVKLILLVVGLLMPAVIADAQEPKTQTFSLATEISHITYKESEMEEKGVMYGLAAAYTYRGPLGERLDKGMLRLEGRLAFGQVDYDGQLMDGTPYEVKNIDDIIAEIRGLGGYDFPVFSATRLTPYVGVAYRYLRDELSTDPAGYNRESNYFYSPVGVETLTAMGNGWSLGASVECDIFWSGWQKSYLSDVASSLNDVNNDQKRGYGVRGSLTVRKNMEKFNLIFSPFIRYWNIEESEESSVTYSGIIIGSAVEPENTSIEYGVNVAVEF